MKNITISLPEDVARWIRIWAAEHDSSVSKMLGNLIKEKMESDNGYEKAMKSFLNGKPRPMKAKGGYPAREELYE
jgi:hypothetical protein